MTTATQERPCKNRRVNPHPEPVPDQCPFCWRAVHDQRFQRLWGLPVTAAAINPAGRPRSQQRRLALPLVKPPCIHLGEDIIYHCHWDDPMRDGRDCALDHDNGRGWVTRNDCEQCPDYRATPSPTRRFEWVSTARLAADAALLAARLPPDAAGIAGIPRSGMIPAAVIATLLQLPLFELTEDGELRQLGHGSRGRNLGFAAGGGPLVVIDDSVYGGGAMHKARATIARLQRRALFAAVYVRPEARRIVDLAGRELPSPHLFEWNVMNNGPFGGNARNPVYGAGIACDFDGIFCHDAESGGPVGSPYLLPRKVSVRLIVTGRQERNRPATEAWLRRWGVRWERLEMLPDAEPFSAEAAARHKAKHFRASGCGFFLESDPWQAAEIFARSGKPVICPIAGRVFQ